MLELLNNGPPSSPRLLLTHGAGAPMDSPFMNAIAEEVAAAGIEVIRFEFEYMAKRREDGKRRGPDRAAKLIA
ncbi:MAG: alpha/beta family hydrolase, partial [Polyangiales bacterium]